MCIYPGILILNNDNSNNFAVCKYVTSFSIEKRRPGLGAAYCNCMPYISIILLLSQYILQQLAVQAVEEVLKEGVSHSAVGYPVRVVRRMSVPRGGGGQLLQCAEVPFLETNAIRKSRSNKMYVCTYVCIAAP